MSNRWIDILASADDESIGAALIRLAGQAVDIHRRLDAESDAELQPADGSAGRPVVPPQGTARTEASR